MKVNLYQVTLTVDGKEVKLTSGQARQFPIMSHSERIGLVEDVRKPLGKVLTQTILPKSSYKGWLYLTLGPNGLQWEPACVFLEGYQEQRISAGYNVDDPTQVPMIIL